MKGSLLLLLALLHGGCLQGEAADSVCTSQSGCQCVTSKVTIDLSNYFTYPMKGIKDPRQGMDKFTYSFSPCQPITCYQGQNNTAAACQHNSKDPDQSVSLGVDSQIHWTSVTDDRNFEILITGGHPTNPYSGHPSVPRYTSVKFSSNNSTDSKNTLIFTHDVYSPHSNDTYYFEASIVTASGGGGGVPDGTVGIVLIVIFIVVVATYFIVGGLIMYFMRGARGVEVIPNYTFWKDLPFLIKDGFLFTISPCRRKFSEKGYQAL